MAMWLLKLLPVFLVFLTITPDLSSTIEVTDLNFPNKTQHSFTVEWSYQLNGYSVSQLLGFEITISNAFDTELLTVNSYHNTSYHQFIDVESGTVFLVCVAPKITDDRGNKTCGYVTTYYDGWNTRAQLALYIGIIIFVVLVVLVVYDFLYPRTPSGGGKQPQVSKTLERERQADLTKSDIELTSNMH